jgi:hypothetical protein
MLTASSALYGSSAAQARLHGSSSWRPYFNDNNPWLQIDLGEIHYVCAVATQGDPYYWQMTTKYKLRWSLDGVDWIWMSIKVKNLEKNMVIFP